MANPRPSSPSTPNPKVQAGFVDLDKLKSSDGIVGIVSMRVGNGALTFGVFKEFERDGVFELTRFISDGMGDSFEAMTKMVRARLVEIRDFIDGYRLKNRGNVPTFEEIREFTHPADRKVAK